MIQTSDDLWHMCGPKRILAALVLLVACLLTLSGCAAAAAEAAGPAIDYSTQLIRAGKSEAYIATPEDQVAAAARTAADDLGLTYVREVQHPDQLKLVYKDQRKQEIVITIIRRTPKATEMHVDVGVMGAQGLGELTLHTILKAFPEKPALDKTNQNTKDAATLTK